MTISRVILVGIGLMGGGLAGITFALMTTWVICAIAGIWDEAFRQAGWTLALVTIPIGAILGAGCGAFGGYWVGRQFLGAY